ncbi:hypothetical protein, partial [Candidatus Chlorohelix sp.]|uniref:hypothetical protein n=1 Tax=Candidatus Chlorohelix sp. TaxID=3139201 RepID=UPI00303AC090
AIAANAVSNRAEIRRFLLIVTAFPEKIMLHPFLLLCCQKLILLLRCDTCACASQTHPSRRFFRCHMSL